MRQGCAWVWEVCIYMIKVTWTRKGIYTYNCVRPHQTLGYKAPLQFLKDNGIINNYSNPSDLSHM